MEQELAVLSAEFKIMKDQRTKDVLEMKELLKEILVKVDDKVPYRTFSLAVWIATSIFVFFFYAHVDIMKTLASHTAIETERYKITK